MIVKKLFSMLCLLGIFSTPALFAQTEEEAAAAYNKGAALVQTDAKGAIAAFEQAIELASKAGEAAKPILDNSKTAIPGLYKQIADKLVQEQKLEEAVAGYEATIKAAEKYGNESIASAAKDAIPQIEFALSGKALAAKDYTGAIAYLDKVLATSPDNLDASFLKGEALRASGKTAEAVAIYEQVIAKAKTAGNTELIGKAQKSAANVFLAEASGLMKEKKNNEAQLSLEKALTFDETNLGALQTLVQLYAGKKLNDKVIETATKFIAAKGESAKESTTIYYMLGTAYQAKNNNAKACEAYKVALNDKNAQIKAFVKAQIETVLKCK